MLFDQPPVPVMPPRSQVLQNPVPPDPHRELTGLAVQRLHHGGLPGVAAFNQMPPDRQVRELGGVVM